MKEASDEKAIKRSLRDLSEQKSWRAPEIELQQKPESPDRFKIQPPSEFHRQNFRNSFEHFMELLKDNNGLREWTTRYNESWNSVSDLFAEAFESFGCYIDDKGDCKIKEEVE